MTALPPGCAAGPGGPAFGPGFFGKLPSHGDFVSRELARSFVQPWDHWLQRGLSTAWSRVGNHWPQLFQDGPLWRFALQAGVCGEAAVAGVLVPSQDRSGRSFPLSIAAAVPPGADLGLLPVAAAGWFGRLETLSQRTLAQGLDADALQHELLQIGNVPESSPSSFAAALPGQVGWQVPLPPAPAPALVWPAVVHEMVRLLEAPFSLWWTLGTATIPPCLLVCPYLPLGEAFIALYDGDWRRWNWDSADTVLSDP